MFKFREKKWKFQGESYGWLNFFLGWGIGVLVAGFLVSGCWLLVAGCWLLVTGCWFQSYRVTGLQENLRLSVLSAWSAFYLFCGCAKRVWRVSGFGFRVSRFQSYRVTGLQRLRKSISASLRHCVSADIYSSIHAELCDCSVLPIRGKVNAISLFCWCVRLLFMPCHFVLLACSIVMFALSLCFACLSVCYVCLVTLLCLLFLLLCLLFQLLCLPPHFVMLACPFAMYDLSVCYAWVFFCQVKLFEEFALRAFEEFRVSGFRPLLNPPRGGGLEGWGF